MNDDRLIWKVNKRKTICRTPVFDVIEQNETGPDKTQGSYVAITAPDWVVVVPVLGESFYMVKQWRHGFEGLSVEFPAGVCDEGEAPENAAKRELLEETGCIAGKLTLLCECNPNPALFKNRLYIFLAEDLVPTGKQDLDADEFLSAFTVPITEVTAQFGTGLYQHAYTGTAVGMYLRHKLTI